MRSTLLATVAAVGLIAAPQAAFASPEDKGYVELRLGFGSTNEDWRDSGDTFFDDPFDWGARTGWLFPLSQPVHIQADVFFQQTDDIFIGKMWNGGHRDSELFGATAHIIHPTSNARFGVAGSLFSLDAHAPNFSNGHQSVDYGLVALEAQWMFDHMTMMGQGGWFGVVTCNGSEGCVRDGVFFRLNTAYFFTPNSSLSFDGNIFFGEDVYRGDVSGGNAALEGEWRFTDSCFSGFANLNYEREDVDFFFGTAAQSTVTVSLGARMYLDSDTLFSFSQSGASFNTPTFHHALASEGALQTEATLDNAP